MSTGVLSRGGAFLALALQTGFPAPTTEGDWLKCDTGVRIVRIW
jgi:hypothetical protein